MTTLTYTSLPLPQPYPRKYLLAAALCFVLIPLLWLLAYFTYSPYTGLPNGLVETFMFAFFSSWLAPVFAITALIKIPGRIRSFTKTLAVSLSACLFITTPGIYLLASQHAFPLGRSRMSPRSLIMANARGIAQSAAVYAADHRDQFPPHLALLILDGFISPKCLVIPLGSPPCLLPSPPPPPTAWRSLAPAIDAHCDFIYTAADLTVPRITYPADIIVLYTKPSPHFTGRIIAFADGHAEFLTPSAITATFAKSNTARAFQKLPPFTLDGPPPLPPTP